MTSEGSNRNCKPGYRILSLVLALVLIIPFAAGCKASGGPSGGASDGEENSNFMSMYGTVAHYDGYTYYIQSGFDNDASVTGTSYSDNIYRISDDRDAEPELIYSVPADMVYGVDQWTIYCLAASGGRLWFLTINRADEKEIPQLQWISPDGSETGASEPCGIGSDADRISFEPIGFDSGRYFFRLMTYTGSEEAGSYRSYNVYFDTASETWGEVDMSFLKDRETAYILCAGGGYVYFVKGAMNEYFEMVPANGIYRMPSAGGDYEEVASFDMGGSDPSDIMNCYADSEHLYYMLESDEYVLYAIRLSNGESVRVLGEEEGLQEEYFPTWCVSGDELWFVNDKGLYRANNEGGNVELVAEDPSGETKMGPVVCGDWIFYSLNDLPEYARIAKDGRIFPAEAIVNNSRDRALSEHDEGEWTYTQYPKYIEITGYNGSASEVTVPSEINGLPVYSFGCWYPEMLSGVKKLILPEGLKSVNYIHGAELETIELPSSLVAFTHRNLVYSFRTDKKLKLVYNGTKEQLKAVDMTSERYYGDMGIDADYGDTTYSIECTDGTIKIDDPANGWH